MRSKRRKRRIAASITVAISVIVTADPDLRHHAVALFELIFGF